LEYALPESKWNIDLIGTATIVLNPAMVRASHWKSAGYATWGNTNDPTAVNEASYKYGNFYMYLP
jgi:hypothetical protein